MTLPRSAHPLIIVHLSVAFLKGGGSKALNINSESLAKAKAFVDTIEEQ